MTQTRSIAQDVQDEILKTVRRSQEAVIEAVQTWAETVQAITPKLPSVKVPFAGQLPRPDEIVASACGFAEQLLASQRKFAEDLLKVTAAAMPGRENGETPKAKPAAK